MIRINLLGTERSRVRARGGITQAQKITAASVLLLLLAAGYIGYRYWNITNESAELDQELVVTQQRHMQLQSVLNEVKRFEEQKAALTQRVSLIEQLRRGQTGPVHMLDEISRALPDRLWLVELTQKGDEVNIDGRTSTLTALSDFVANLQNSQYFKRPVEIVSSSTETDPQGELVRFVVKAVFVPGGSAQAGPPAPGPVPPAPGQGRN